MKTVTGTGRRAAWPALMLGAAAIAAAGATRAPPAQPVGEPPTREFRAHHAEIREHLGHIDARVAGLEAQDAARQAQGMRFVVGFLTDHIAPHAADEERVLYPVVDRKAGGGENAFTATMRHDHTVVARWIEELTAEAAKDSPDAAAFARRAQRLLGLLEAHFEAEEDVLLALLDRTMTPQEFRAEVADKLGR